MLIDTHAHLNFQAYTDDLAEVIERCHEAQMKVINVGAAFDTSKRAADLAKQEKDFYAAIGLHPIHVFDEEFKVSDYQALIDDYKEKIVAMGETGFDYFHLDESLQKGAKSITEIKEKQKKVFAEHIKLAKDNNLALIIHGRNGNGQPAYQDIYNLLENQKYYRGVIHCYGGNLAEAKKFMKLGFYLGFTGITTFDKTGVLEEIVKWIPEDRFLIETDAPYLTPVPFRGHRNEPIYVKHVAEKIAEIKNKTTEEIIAISYNNAKRLFKI